MNFVSIRIITADIGRLVHFYERITGIPVTMYTEDFGELKTPACTLAMAARARCGCSAATWPGPPTTTPPFSSFASATWMPSIGGWAT